MTVLTASGRVWHRNWLVYRRLWHRSLAFGFLQPVLFLTAMGVGLGALLTPEDLSAFGGFDYITWLGPGLLAAMAMQTATFESTYPIMNKIMWGRNYEAMLSTPLQIRNIVWGELAWSAFRIGTLAVVFLVVLALFGIPQSPLAVLAIPFTILIGLAFSSCLIAFTATQKNDVGFSAVFRFIINPLFLFSGTFFPLTQLPEPAAGHRVADAAVPRRPARAWLDPRHARAASGAAEPHVPARDVRDRGIPRRAQPDPTDGGLGRCRPSPRPRPRLAPPRPLLPTRWRWPGRDSGARGASSSATSSSTATSGSSSSVASSSRSST